MKKKEDTSSSRYATLIINNSKKADCKLLLNNVLHSKAVALFVMSVVLHKLLWHFHCHFQHNQLLV